MLTLLITVTTGLFFYIVKTMIDINTLILKVIKDKELTSQSNELEKEYQFIKGLF